MARWEPDARTRLESAALDLFAERGYEQTTVSEIAARAGLTQRTFFRHYADKREVLFAGGRILQDAVVAAVRDAPADASPLDAVVTGMTAGAAMLEQRRDLARRRQQIIDAHPDLQERELIKLAHLGSAVAEGLRGRGVREPSASLTAQLGVAVFHRRSPAGSHRTAAPGWRR